MLSFNPMANYKKARFLKRALNLLNKKERENIKKLAQSLLLIQNSDEASIGEKAGKAVVIETAHKQIDKNVIRSFQHEQ